jgi:hypothetical protein
VMGAVLAAGLLGLAAGSLLGRAPHRVGPQPTAPASAALPVLGVETALLRPAIDPPAPPPAPPAAKAPPRAERVKLNRPGRSPSAAARSRRGCSTSAGCLRAEMASADRELRQAYGNAVRGGVSRSLLEDYRDDWNDLRDLASSNPKRMVDEYRSLARDLEKRTAKRQIARVSERRSGRLVNRYASGDE